MLRSKEKEKKSNAMEKQRINTTQAEAQWFNQATNYQQYERAQKDFDEMTWRHKA